MYIVKSWFPRRICETRYVLLVASYNVVDIGLIDEGSYADYQNRLNTLKGSDAWSGGWAEPETAEDGCISKRTCNYCRQDYEVCPCSLAGPLLTTLMFDMARGFRFGRFRFAFVESITE